MVDVSNERSKIYYYKIWILNILLKKLLNP